MEENKSIFDDIAFNKPELAGRWARLFAYIIDVIIIYIPITFLYFIPVIDYETFQYISSILNLVFFIVYFSILESSASQASIGKKLLGIKVCDENYQRISFSTALGRTISKLIPAGVFFILFTERKQGLHDKICKTLVVKA